MFSRYVYTVLRPSIKLSSSRRGGKVAAVAVVAVVAAVTSIVATTPYVDDMELKRKKELEYYKRYGKPGRATKLVW